jgi:hypothetical protein
VPVPLIFVREASNGTGAFSEVLYVKFWTMVTLLAMMLSVGCFSIFMALT